MVQVQSSGGLTLELTATEARVVFQALLSIKHDTYLGEVAEEVWDAMADAGVEIDFADNSPGEDLIRFGSDGVLEVVR